MPVPKTDALPLGYTPYGLVLDGRTNGERGKGEAGLEERAVQERGQLVGLCPFFLPLIPLYNRNKEP